MATPYQIRSDLLHLAQEILESQSRSKKNSQHGGNVSFPHGDDHITTEQIITEAAKLNAFVSNLPTIVTGDLHVEGTVHVAPLGNVMIHQSDESFERSKK